MHGVLTARDKEILRTLLRVQLANTASLQQVFFPSLRVAQRRLQVLRGRGLVRNHAKGLPGGYGARGSSYWRLTPGGLEAVVECFPDEPIPDNAVDRAAQGSLRFFEHRNQVADLYLALIADRHQDAAEMSRRASSFGWAGEHGVVLDYDKLGGSGRIVPDATITSPAKVRVFLELDRSTESRKRCERAVKAYSSYVRQGHYAQDFADELTPYLLYATKSNARRKSLHSAFGPIATASLEVVVLALPDAIQWVRRGLYGDDDGAVALAQAAADPGERDAGFRDEAMTRMTELYEAYLADLERRRDAGERIAAPPCLQEAYDFILRERGR